MKYDIKDLSLALKGRLKIEWASRQMKVLSLIKKRFEKHKPLKGITIAACLHVTSETANLMLTLKAGGAKVYLSASNPLSTQDDVAASLVKDFKINTFAIKGEDNKTYYKHLNQVLDFYPQITLDDGGDLISLLHKKRKKQIKNIIGSCEETTTGVIRLRAMEKDGALKAPVIAVNDSATKRFFDNRYGTGQSTIDGILRATNLLLAGKNFVVCGFGWCGRGIAIRAKGMGAKVIVCETNPIKALEAYMDGYQVMNLNKAVKVGNIFVTATGDKNVIDTHHLKLMKDGAILANSGHFNVEINVKKLEKMAAKKRKIRENLVEYIIPISRPVRRKPGQAWKRIYLLAQGRLVNLAAAEGHPAEVMDMSFSNQALAVEYLIKNKGKFSSKVYVLPKKLDKKIASLKLESLGVSIDKLSQEQKKYLSSWREGT